MKLTRSSSRWCGFGGRGRALVLFACTLLCGAVARGQSLNVGSDGSDGVFVFVPDVVGGNTMTIDLGLAASGLDGGGMPITWQTPSPVPGRGVYDASIWCVVFKYSALTIPSSKTIRFLNHPSRAPVVWLVQDSASIQGEIILSGSTTTSGRGEPGPGGFRGPLGGSTASHGPGGGLTGGAAGCHATCYGSPSCKPLIGGSGAPSSGNVSSGGGGAMLLAAANDVIFGPGGRIFSVNLLAGTIRIVAHRIVRALPSGSQGLNASTFGRIRLESNLLEGDGALVGNPTPIHGAPSAILPDANTPTVEVVSIDPPSGPSAAVPLDPRASTDPSSADVIVQGTGTATVHLRARNATVGSVCYVRVQNALGTAAVYVSTPLVGTAALSTATVQVPLSPGVFAVIARTIL